MLILFRFLQGLFRSEASPATVAVKTPTGPKGPLALLAHELRFDLLAQFRNPRARFFTIAFPLILLVVFNGVFKGHTVVDGHRISLTQFYIPGIMAQAVVAAAYATVVISVATLRESGILKRRRATPVQAWVLITGQALSTVVTAFVMTTVLLLVAKLAYSTGYAPGSLAAMYVMVAVGTLTLGCIGWAVAGLVKNVDAAQPIVQITMLPLWFISGVFIPTATMSKGLRAVGDIFPVEHLANPLHLASVHSSFTASIHLVDVAVLLGWALAALAITVRRFSWLPSAA